MSKDNAKQANINTLEDTLAAVHRHGKALLSHATELAHKWLGNRIEEERLKEARQRQEQAALLRAFPQLPFTIATTDPLPPGKEILLDGIDGSTPIRPTRIVIENPEAFEFMQLSAGRLNLLSGVEHVPATHIAKDEGVSLEWPLCAPCTLWIRVKNISNKAQHFKATVFAVDLTSVDVTPLVPRR